MTGNNTDIRWRLQSLSAYFSQHLVAALYAVPLIFLQKFRDSKTFSQSYPSEQNKAQAGSITAAWKVKIMKH